MDLTLLRKLRTRLQNLVLRASVDRPGVRYQISSVGDSSRSDIEHMEPQGLHFRAPVGAEGIELRPGAVPENSVLVCAQGDAPEDVLLPGEGGLHYLGTFKVFCKSNGEVHLAGGTGAADFVALAQKVDTAIANIRTYINAHVHPGVTTGGGVTGAVAVPLGAQASSAAAKVKAT
jgi:hypothetical protein